MKTFGRSQSGEASGSGSSATQSSAAPAIRPSRSASISAGSTTTLPRATFTRCAEGFIRDRAPASISPSVSGVSGQVSTTKSARGNSDVSAAVACTSSAPLAPAEGSRRRPMTCMPKALASRASRPPMRPSPTTSMVLPPSSSSRFAISPIMPRQTCFAWLSRAMGNSRLTASTSAMACSETAFAFTPAALARRTPRSRKAGWAYWSTPALMDCT